MSLTGCNEILEENKDNIDNNKLSLKNEFDYEYYKLILKLEQLQYSYSYQLSKNDKTNLTKKDFYDDLNAEGYFTNYNSKKKKAKGKDDSSFNKDNDTSKLSFEEPNAQSSKKSPYLNNRTPNQNKQELENLQSETTSSILTNQEVYRIDRLNNIGGNSEMNKSKITEENEKLKLKKNQESPLDNASCRICNRVPNNKIALQKCYNENCGNVLCQDCYSRNHYQVRASSYRCNYFNCDQCCKKNICIMTTIFCNACEKRICSCCYISNHSDHGNVKICSK